jgi:hypothetical protein
VRGPKLFSDTYVWMNKLIEVKFYEHSSPLEKISALFRQIVSITPEISNEPFVAYIKDNMV